MVLQVKEALQQVGSQVKEVIVIGKEGNTFGDLINNNGEVCS
jgi:hypothetical protein